MIHKSVNIREDQEAWIKKNHFMLSSFVREKLDERIAMEEDLRFRKASETVKE